MIHGLVYYIIIPWSHNELCCLLTYVGSSMAMYLTVKSALRIARVMWGEMVS